MSIRITGTFTPSGNFGVVEDANLIGGYQIVDTKSDRDNISVLKRKFGMLVYVKEDNALYQLMDDGSGDLSNNNLWQDANLGGGGGTDFQVANGLTVDESTTPETLKLGGALSENTTIDTTSSNYTFSITKTGTNNEFKIDYNNKIIQAQVQGDSLLDTSSINVSNDAITLSTDIDNGDNTQTGYYLKIDKTLKNISSNLPTCILKNSNNSTTSLIVNNSNENDNNSDARIVATSSDTDNQDNTYMAHFGSAYYISQYQNNGALFTDNSLWIGNPYSNAENIHFVLGDGFDTPNTRLYINDIGINITNNNLILYNKGRTPSDVSNITKTFNVILNSDFGEIQTVDHIIPQKNVKHSKRTGADYTGASKTLDFGIYFRKDDKNVKIYLNGTLLTYNTDWKWSEFPKMPSTSPVALDYTTKIELLNPPASDNDVYELIYDEYIVDGLWFDIRAIAWDGTQRVAVRDRLITKTISIGAKKYFLSSVTKNGLSYTCQYTNVADSSDTHSIVKTFANSVYFPQFKINETLNFGVEIWKENKACSFNSKTNTYDRPTMELGNHLIPAYLTDTNLIVFDSKGSLKYRGTYFIRFRFNDASGNVYYSEFQPYKISRKYFNIFTTDSTTTVDKYEGVYDTIRIIY